MRRWMCRSVPAGAQLLTAVWHADVGVTPVVPSACCACLRGPAPIHHARFNPPLGLQVAFQLYEDAPQELRSRLWMAVLEHPELCAEYQTLAAALQQQRAAAAAVAAPALEGESGAVPAEQAGAQHGEQDGEAGDGPAGEHVEGVPGAAAEESAAFLGADPTGDSEDADAAEEAGHLYAAAPADAAPDPAHLSTSYSAPWAAQHQQALSNSSGGLGSPRSMRRQGQPDEDSGWQLVADQAAASRLQGHALLAGAREHPPYSREREGFRNSKPWVALEHLAAKQVP